MEADLSLHHGIRYSDRWRRDEHGARRLTLREIYVRVKHMPLDSATARLENGGRRHWTDLEYLVADVVHALTGKPHPARPKASRVAGIKPRTAERNRALRAARRRAAERQRAIDAGEIT